MSSFDPTKHDYLILKITHENYEKYCTGMHIPVGGYIGFKLRNGVYIHVGIVAKCDYVCSSDEEFDQLIFLHYLEN